MKPTVYIETSVVSYLTSWPSRDLVIAAHQQITRDWWVNTKPKTSCYISEFVTQEASRGDKESAKQRILSIQQIPSLEINQEVEQLAEHYFTKLDLPEKAKIDAFHLAIAAWHNINFMISWNCKHIANGQVIRTLEKLNNKLGLQSPVICTPEELMEV